MSSYHFYLMALATEFPRVWQDPETDPSLKKRIVRTLVEEILVDVDEERGIIDAVIHWAGGCHTALEVRKNRTGQHRFSTDRDVIELVRDLARVAPDLQIARVLNRLRVHTGKGNSWTEGRVRSLRDYYHIPAHLGEEQVARGWLNMAQASAYLGISPMSVRRLLQSGTIPGKQIVAYAPWVIMREDLDTESVGLAVARIRSGRGSPLPEDPRQPTLSLAGKL